MTDERQEEREVRCNRCGERWLWWEERELGQWVLVDEDGEVHRCKSRFKDLEQ